MDGADVLVLLLAVSLDPDFSLEPDLVLELELDSELDSLVDSLTEDDPLSEGFLLDSRLSVR